MPRVYVSVGSNIDRDKNLRSAIEALREHYGVLVLSSVYESVAVGFAGDNFYNLVAVFDTDESLEQVAATLADLETAHGRRREGERFSNRTLDLDILLYGDEIRHDHQFDVPRAEITRHAFVLLPLSEVAGAARHPETGARYRDLWDGFSDDEQKLWAIKIDL